MLSDEEKKFKASHFENIDELIKTCEMWIQDDDWEAYCRFFDMGAMEELINLTEKQSKEIEELKASHITTKNKATNTEKAKIFDVIENSIDTYIEKSKPYWEQIMTKDEMTIEEALTIIDDMYQDRYKIMSQKTEKETIVDLSKMDYIKFTNLEWASVRVLREVQSLLKEIEELKQIKCKLDEKNIPIETLLAEFERLEDLEDDLTTVYLNGVYDGEKKVQDKIKAKIEEIDFMIKEINQGHLQKYTVGELLGAKRFLESLLEKE